MTQQVTQTVFKENFTHNRMTLTVITPEVVLTFIITRSGVSIKVTGNSAGVAQPRLNALLRAFDALEEEATFGDKMTALRKKLDGVNNFDTICTAMGV